MKHSMDRRQMMAGTAVIALGSALPATVKADVVPGTDGFEYEISKSDAQWQAQLRAHDFRILRKGETEVPKSSPLWNERRTGSYHCKACDLHLYDSRWKVEVDKGWVFFRQSVANSLLMAIDWPARAGDDTAGLEALAATEVHCRRCGSHMGHMLIVDGPILHCINGASMTFAPLDA